MRRIQSIFTYANVVATLALFIALGGASYAAVKLPKNSVGATQLRKNAASTSKVADHSLTGADLDLAKLGTVPSAAHAASAGAADTATRAASAGVADAASHAATADAVADDAITGAKVKDNALTGADIADGSLTSADLAGGGATCRAATLLYEGACLETGQRTATFWPDAEAACETVGGHLPSPEQLYGLRAQPGITLNSGGEWTGHFWSDGANTYIELIGQTGFNRKAIVGGAIPYRCSRPPVG